MPMLSVIIPAYNEEEVICRKLRDVYATTLDRTRFEVLVGSDGSVDATVDMAQAFAAENSCDNLRVFSFHNEGKSATMMKLVAQANGDIIIGSDADGVFDNPDLFAHLLKRFETEGDLGGISCVPIFQTGAIEQKYWKTEHAIRNFLSKRGSLYVVTGMGFAFRKSVIDPVPSDIMADDLWLPLSILKNGYRTVSDDFFRSQTEIFPDVRELRRKIRVVKGGIQCVIRFFTEYPHMLLSQAFFWLLVFKVSKWLLPFGLALGLTVLALQEWKLALAMTAFFAASVVTSSRLRYLVYGIFLPMVALWQVMTGTYSARWDHVR